jgi:hypothetical protein
MFKIDKLITSTDQNSTKYRTYFNLYDPFLTTIALKSYYYKFTKTIKICL